MKPLNILTLLVAISCWTGTAQAQLQLATNIEPQCVFFGDARNVSVTFHNTSATDFDGEVRSRIYQTSSATAVLISENPWKQIRVPAGETIVAFAPLDFPVVKAKTKFLVQWLQNSNSIFGRTEILVFPTNLLSELKALASDDAPGVLDPQNQMKPLFKQSGIDFVDLENSGLEDFSGRLAIIGPFQSPSQMRDGLAGQIKKLAKHGVAVVWLLPPAGRGETIKPSFYTVPEGTNAVVVVQPELTANLAANPQSQLNLIQFCRLALQPQPAALPDFSPPQ